MGEHRWLKPQQQRKRNLKYQLPFPLAFGQEIVFGYFYLFLFEGKDRRPCTLKILYGCLIFAQ